MDGVITKEEIARGFAEDFANRWVKCGFDYQESYNQGYKEIIQMDDFEFLFAFHRQSKRWLNVIAKNRYFLY